MADAEQNMSMMAPSIPARPRGLSLIEGDQSGKTDTPFPSTDQNTGAELGTEFFAASVSDVDNAANAAWSAFHAARGFEPRRHAELLEQIAQSLGTVSGPLVEMARVETALGEKKLQAELRRAVGTLRTYAEAVREGSWVEATIDRAGAPGRISANHDLRSMLRPLGPVVVFGASNFPIAYGTLGTDAGSALAAGCPVIIKGHPLHPGTGEIAAWAAIDAVSRCEFPEGWFQFVHAGGAREAEIGAELVRHPCVRAGGFTGSKSGGDVLAKMAASRPDPIPFYAEMGSINPVVVLPGALETEPEKIGRLLAKSVTASLGQQCTCPGLIFATKSDGLDRMVGAYVGEIADAEAAPMLAPRVQARFTRRAREMAAMQGVEVLPSAERIPDPPPPGRKVTEAPAKATPVVFKVSAAIFNAHASLLEEVFGPSTLVVACKDEHELMRSISAVPGSLTATMMVGGADRSLAARIAPMLEHRCGRLIMNGVPTGVEVARAMVHGGPYPASNRPDTTAVGHWSMRKWRRPICFQNTPQELLPPELRDENPLGIERIVDGKRTRAAIQSTRPDELGGA